MNRTATMINVNGISLERILEKELRRISIKAIPLPPIRDVEKKKAFKKAVVKAVMHIITKRCPEPTFSSSSGPTSRIMVRLFIRWDQFACPKIYEIDRR